LKEDWGLSFLPPLADQTTDRPNNRLSADPKPRPDFIAKLRVRTGVILGRLGVTLEQRVREMQLDQATLNITGLVLNMVGVVIIFFFGPPQPTLEEGVGLGLEDGTQIDPSGKTVGQHNREVKRKRMLFSILSKAGLGLIFVGFGFQLYAVLFPDNS
jgi:hypothetical protein